MKPATNPPLPKTQETYYLLAEQSKELAQVAIRENLFTHELASQLGNFGGAKWWFAILVLAVVLTVWLTPQSSLYLHAIGLGCVSVVAYVGLLWGLASIKLDIELLRGGRSVEHRVYRDNVNLFFNATTLYWILPVLFLLVVVTAILSRMLAQIAVQVLVLVGLIGFVFIVLSFSVGLFSDARRLYGALRGSDTEVVYSTRMLVAKLYHDVEQQRLVPSRLSSLLSFAETQLRHAELRFEISNVLLALIALFLAAIFSDQVGFILDWIYQAVNYIIDSIIQTTSGVLGAGRLFGALSAPLLRITLWVFVIDLLIGSMLLVLNRIASIVYFMGYRPTFALFQALTLLVHSELPADADDSE